MPNRSERRVLNALMLVGLTLVVGTIGYRLLTNNEYGWLTCFYMTVITLSTVGYGEVIDASQFPLVRAFTIVLILSGMGILFYSLSTVTAIMVEMDLRDVIKRRKMNKDIRQLRDHFIVCGFGVTGSCIAQELIKTGARIVVIENNPERIETLRKLDDVLHVEGDTTDDEVLIRAGIDRASGLAAALSSEKDNLFLTLTARQLNPAVRIVARGLDDSVNRKLQKAGADAVVSTTFIGSLRMASELIRPSVVSFLDTMLRETTQTIRFEELHISPESTFINQTINSTGLREDFDLLIVALKKPDSSQFIYNPPADTVLVSGMTLVVLGKSKQVQELRELSTTST